MRETRFFTKEHCLGRRKHPQLSTFWMQKIPKTWFLTALPDLSKVQPPVLGGETVPLPPILGGETMLLPPVLGGWGGAAGISKPGAQVRGRPAIGSRRDGFGTG